MSPQEMSLTLLSVLLLGLFFTPSHSTTFTVRNDCPYTVWAAASPGGGQRLDHGQKWILNVSQGNTTGRIWGRTNCSFDASGRGHCQTGDCGGVLECQGFSTPPYTLTEYALNQVNNTDYYDISLVDGFNIPIEFSPASASSQDNCKPINCSGNVNAECPDELKAPGGCNNPCTVFKTAEYCCTTGSCSMTTYARYFVSKCPDAYGYPQDNPNMFTCPRGSTDYRVVFCPDSNGSSSKKPVTSSSKKLVTITVASAISGLLIVVMALSIIWKRRMKSRGLPSGMDDIDLPLYDFATVAVATNHFSETNKLGAGGFGSVYKGTLSSGQEVAVKRLSKYSGQGPDEFMNEVLLIARLQHRNLVGLVGCCIEREERMLIYEYMPNKSLDYFIFDHDRSSSLAWKRRFDIILGIARGLLYLHRDSKLQVIHRDLKTSNILLDADMNPKISDFGLARIFRGDGTEAETRRIVGTHGYMSPEYVSDGKFSIKSDVFSFGVLLLEIVSGKRNRGFQHPNHYHNLLGHAWILWSEGRAMELIDESVCASFVESQVERCIQVGLLCAQNFPEDRPMMSSVVFMLENEGATLPLPKEPGFFVVRNSGSSDAHLVKEESNTNNVVTITFLEGR